VFDEGKRPGRQYIREATALAGIEDGQYEFVLSSHTLEHTANPIRAIREWSRVLQGGGILVLVVPHRNGTFDHRRPVTTLAHLQDDFERGAREDDTTHLPEILALHDLGRDPGAQDRATFEARAARNEENRSLHHHVFDTDLVARLLDSLDLRILCLQPLKPCHIVAVAQKRPWTGEANNRAFVGADAAYRSRSPFKTDRLTPNSAPHVARAPRATTCAFSPRMQTTDSQARRDRSKSVTTGKLHVLLTGRFSDADFGGLERHVRSLPHALSEDCDFVNVVGSRRWHFEHDQSTGCPTYKLPALFHVTSMPICPTMPWWMWKLHRARPFDLVHMHFPDPMAHLASLVLPRSLPVVITWHSDIVRQERLLKLYRPLQDAILKRAAAIIAPTPAHFATSSELMRLPISDRFRTVPFGIDVQTFARQHPMAAAIRARYPEALVFALGRHVYYKGFEYLIDAMEATPGARLLLGGTGPLTDSLHQRAASSRAADRITFLGRIPDEDLPAYYQACDVFCMPSVERSEAFGIVQIEAMAAGKPVVCCELGNGVTYVNRHGVTGLVVPPRDVPALAGALRALVDDAAMRASLGAQGRMRVDAEFSMQALRRGTLEVYQEALGRA
jgi:rhamnosyl/mannosyltransferase